MTASVTSDSGAVYQVALGRGEYKTRDHGYIATTCTCPSCKDGSSCKHTLAFGLHLLGYRPEHEATAETEPKRPANPADIVPLLVPGVVADILIRACATHPDIAALVQHAHARTGTFDDLLSSTKAAVDAVLGNYDYDRRWRYVGSAVSDPLRQMLDDTTDPSPDLALAVALAGLYALNAYDVDDRYGDLIHTMDDALVAAHKHHLQLTGAQQELLAGALAELACKSGDDSLSALFGDDYYDETQCGPLMPELIGDTGRSHIRSLQTQFAATAQQAQQSPGNPAVAQTRQAQIADATLMADRCQDLLDLLER